MRITEHFDSVEFDSRDGSPFPIEWVDTRLRELCYIFEKVHKEAGTMHILSGYRTPLHNLNVGGKPHSLHLQGLAADICPRDISVKKLYKIFCSLIKSGDIPDGGLHEYKTFVHYDNRGERARW